MAGRKRPIRKPFPVTKDNEDLESLFVFGYECKQFRDDEKALYIDQGRHLIPWMGDSSLLIDRYDGRGHLYDLHLYDAANANKEDGLSEEERRVEALCDEERYLELHTDMSEKALYEEEELKRLNQAFSEAYDYGGYAAVGFNYDYYGNPQESETQQTDQDQDDEDDEPYEVPPELQLPPGMDTPSSLKSAKIIEKTAKFVSAQGVQMEILIKTKQSDNPQFAFLEHGEPLNLFYKHMKMMIKSGRYKPREDKPELERQNSQPDGQEYLHPKLMKLMRQDPEPEPDSKDFLESVKAKLPSGQLSNSLYAKLVSNMKQVSNGRSSPAPVRPAIPKKLVAESAASASSYAVEPSVSPVPQQALEPTSYVAAHTITTQPQPPGVYMTSEITLPPPPGMEPVTLPSSTPPAASQPPPPGTVSPATAPLESTGYVDVLNGAYGGDMSYEEEQETMPNIIIPPPDQQPIVDKMAAYVAKNGPDFEAVVRNKVDERFHFLNAWHMHNKYYEYRKSIYQKELAANNVKVTITQTSQNAAGDTVVTKTTTTLADVNVSQPSKGVSFSIKTKDSEGTALTSRNLMLYDSSDDEDQEGNKAKRDTESDSSESRGEANVVQEKSKAEKIQPNPEEVERRNAEERSKDRISIAAREKVAQAGREKILQQERKRRAAMFINMLKGSATPSGSGTADPSSVSTALPAASRSPASTTGQTAEETAKDSAGAAVSSPSPSTKNSPRVSRSPSPPVHRSTSRASSSTKSPTRTRSPARSSLSERHRVRDYERRKHRSPRRSRSRSPVWRRRYQSRSRSPPSAYAVVRRSRSKSASRKRSRTRSKSPPKHKKKRATRSRSRERLLVSHSRMTKSPSRIKEKKSRKRSRSKSPSRKHKSRSRSRSRKTKSRSRSPTSSKKSKKSHKHKSRSPSKSNRGGSKSREGSVSKLSSIPEVKTPVQERPLPLTLTSYGHRSHKPADDNAKDDDVIVISPVKEDCASPVAMPTSAPPPMATLSEATPPVATPSVATPSVATPPAATPLEVKPPQPNAPISKDLLSKVRAMLKASRAQILKEEGPLSLD